MKPLLHICCAPCAISCIRQMKEDGLTPTGYWDNPNIHPFTEYKARRNALIEYATAIDLDLIVAGEYGLRPFVQAVCHDVDNRCGHCYTCRLESTAQYAVTNGFDAFTTTLLVSPYQNYELICETGERIADQYGISFLPYDFRPGFREGQQEARDLGLYMQKYCGCIFSEEERYVKKKVAK